MTFKAVVDLNRSKAKCKRSRAEKFTSKIYQFAVFVSLTGQIDLAIKQMCTDYRAGLTSTSNIQSTRKGTPVRQTKGGVVKGMVISRKLIVD